MVSDCFGTCDSTLCDLDASAAAAVAAAVFAAESLRVLLRLGGGGLGASFLAGASAAVDDSRYNDSRVTKVPFRAGVCGGGRLVGLVSWSSPLTT